MLLQQTFAPAFALAAAPAAAFVTFIAWYDTIRYDTIPYDTV